MPKSAQREFLVKVAGLDGYFMTKSGGNLSSDTNKVYDGGNTVPEVIAAPAEVENVTVSRAYDKQRDPRLLTDLRRRVGKWTTTISVTPTDADLVPIEDPTVYSNALLVGLNEPEADASGGDAATYELEFAVASVR